MCSNAAAPLVTGELRSEYVTYRGRRIKLCVMYRKSSSRSEEISTDLGIGRRRSKIKKETLYCKISRRTFRENPKRRYSSLKPVADNISPLENGDHVRSLRFARAANLLPQDIYRRVSGCNRGEDLSSTTASLQLYREIYGRSVSVVLFCRLARNMKDT